MRRTINYIFTLGLFFLLLHFSTSAQLEFSGRVLDAKTKKVISGAEITVKNTNLKTTSDNSGFFQFSENVEIPCTLVISSEDYISVEYEIQKNKTDVPISLEPIKKEIVENS